MSKNKAEVLGDIYDVTGALVACISSESPLMVGGLSFSVVIKGDWLQLVKTEGVVLNFQNELHKKKEDLLLVKANISKLTSSEEETENEGQRLAELIAISRNHTATIKEMEERHLCPTNYVLPKAITVKYRELQKGQAVELLRGRLDKLPFFSKPVVWCPKVEANPGPKLMHGDIETKFDVAPINGHHRADVEMRQRDQQRYKRYCGVRWLCVCPYG